MADEEETLQFGPDRPPLPRRVRMLAVVAVVLGAAVFGAARLWPGANPPPHAATESSPSVTTSAPVWLSPSPTPSRTWPWAPGSCGGDVWVPLVSAGRSAERTRATVMIGGDRISTVDFDTGRVGPVPGASLAHGEFVNGLTGSPRPYAVTFTCRSPHARRVLHVGAEGEWQLCTPGNWTRY